MVYVCAVCGNRFENGGTFSNHKDVHGPGYPCAICGAILRQRKSLARHVRERHEHMKRSDARPLHDEVLEPAAAQPRVARVQVAPRLRPLDTVRAQLCGHLRAMLRLLEGGRVASAEEEEEEEESTT
jgi:DNA-directed RNA polymerase subunit RPC12/RpoP